MHTFGRPQYVSVAEASNEDDATQVVEGDRTNDQIIHGDVIDFEPGHVQSGSHLAVAVAALLADYSHLRPLV